MNAEPRGAADQSAPPNRRPSIGLTIVVAVGENGVIGRHGTLPWRLKGDMRHFRALTMGKPVVMGRKTYDSLQLKPLPGRTNIVVSRDPSFAASGVLVAPDIQTALAVGRADALRRGADAVMMIGGAEIFRQTLDIADRLEITTVHASPEGDAFFAVDATRWRELVRVEHPRGPGDDVTFTTISYARVS